MTSQELETIKAAMTDELEKIAAFRIRVGRVGIKPGALPSFRGSLGKKKFGGAKGGHFLDRTVGPLALMAGGAGVYHYGRKYHQDRNMGRQIRMQQQMQPY
jgi:hypothetical protein